MKRLYNGVEYDLVKRNVKVGDIILLNANTPYEKIVKVYSNADLNDIDGWTGAIQRKDYYVLIKS